jgi:chemotaxis protein MotB
MAEEQQQGTHKEQPIIVKKIKKGGHAGHHGGAWKVAYADFVTAMMAFFIVMWILASSEEVKKAVTDYFENPGAFSYITGKRTVPVKIDVLPKKDKPGQGSQNSNSAGMQISFNESQKDSLLNKVSDVLKKQAITDSIKAYENIKKMGDELKKQFTQELTKNPEMKEILSAIKIEMTKEGLRIELIESKESLFFLVGSAKLSAPAMEILKTLGEKIATFPNNVEIEGHTDARQYGKSASYNNYDLSSDRANSARRVLAKYFWTGQIDKVSGFADRRLRTPDNPFDVSNRRVSILIKQLTASDFLKETQNQIEGEEGK